MTPPAAPSGLTATAGIGQVALSWTETADNEAGFKIERASGGGAFTEVGWVGANGTNYFATGLTPGTSYSFQVRAFNAGGNSGYSNTATEAIRHVIDFDSLPAGTIVTTQYLGVVVSGDPAYPNQIIDDTDASEPNSLGVPTSFNRPLYMDFVTPVNNLKFYQLRDQTTGTIAEVNVFERGLLSATVPIIGTNTPFVPDLVDLSAYHDVTRIEIVNITDPFGLLWDDFSFTPAKVDLQAHRTGGKFGEVLSQAIEDGGDPTQYLILSNNDFEEAADGQLDFADTSATIPVGTVDPLDDDLARITLKSIGSAVTDGTIELSISDPGAVRFFKSDGTPLTTLAQTIGSAGYLSDLTSKDVDVYVEGLRKSPNLTISLVYKDAQGVEVSRDDVHMLVAEWAFVGYDGTEVDAVANFPKQDLVDLAAGDPEAATPDESQYFKIRIDGLASANVQQLTVTSDESPDDFYVDDLVTSTSRAESANFGLLYSSGISGDLLTSAERSAIKQALQFNAIRNPAAQAVATTQAGDVQKRAVKKLNPKEKVHAILDAQDATHNDKLYYSPSGTDKLFPLLKWGVNQVDVAESKKVGGKRNASAKYRDTKNQIVISLSPTWQDVVHESVHAVDDMKGWYITLINPDLKKAEALGYATERLLDAVVAGGPATLSKMEAKTFATPGDAQLYWDLAWQSLNAVVGTNYEYWDGLWWTAQLTSADVADVGAKLGFKFSANALLPIYNQMLQAKGLPANSLTNNFSFALHPCFA